MNVFRSALSACVVQNLPNIRDYIQCRTDEPKKSKRKNKSSSPRTSVV